MQDGRWLGEALVPLVFRALGLEFVVGWAWPVAPSPYDHLLYGLHLLEECH